ncbi:hypothetical protein T492DRAFT_941183 [Pavlovales sp. CCMP2436]|nr:hypothetical protein T492DRAFT_941183 [Pavlovales sp. CCMP2436]
MFCFPIFARLALRVTSLLLAARRPRRRGEAAAARQMACDVVHSSDLVDHEADLPHTGDAHDALRRPSVLA